MIPSNVADKAFVHFSSAFLVNCFNPIFLSSNSFKKIKSFQDGLRRSIYIRRYVNGEIYFGPSGLSTQRGDASLFLAVKNNHLGLVKLLLQSKISANSITRCGRTPLLQAVKNGNVAMVQLLINARANVYSKQNNGCWIIPVGGDGKTMLHLGAERGQTDMVEILIDAGSWVNCPDKSGSTALHCVSRSGYLTATGIVEKLFAARADLGAQDNCGNTALILAAAEGQIEMVDTLLGMGTPVGLKNKIGLTALMKAVIGGYLAIVARLLVAGADLNAQCEKGKTALMYAVLNKSPDTAKIIVEQLLLAGADIEAKDKKGLTSLMHAAIEGSPGCIKQLLKAGCSTETEDNRGRTAALLAYLARPSRQDIFRMIEESRHKQWILHINTEATTLGFLVVSVLKGRLNINAPSVSIGVSAIYEEGNEADERLKSNLVKVLQDLPAGGIKHGIVISLEDFSQDLNIKMLVCHSDKFDVDKHPEGFCLFEMANDGETFNLLTASAEGQKDIVDTLLTAGIPLELKDSQGLTALMYAVIPGHDSIVAQLLSAQADVNAQSAFTCDTALKYAVIYEHEGILKQLLQAGANLEAMDNKGKTALIHAANRCAQLPRLSQRIVGQLLAARANVQASDKKGYTALMYAAKSGVTEIIKQLLEAGANAEATDSFGNTALEIAVFRNHLEACNMIEEAKWKKWVLHINTGTTSLESLVNAILKEKLGVKQPRICVGSCTIYEEGTGADERLQMNYLKPLYDLPAGGIKHGVSIIVEDFSQSLKCNITVYHCDKSDVETNPKGILLQEMEEFKHKKQTQKRSFTCGEDHHPCKEAKLERVELFINTVSTTLEFLVNSVLKQRLHINEPSVSIGSIIIYEEGTGANDRLETNKTKTLQGLPAGGIKDGVIIIVEDFLQDINFNIIVYHREERDLQIPLEGFILKDYRETSCK